MASGLEIDWETADKITLASLKDQLAYLKREIKDHEKRGAWMHPEDYHKSKVALIPALKLIMHHYGG